MSNKSFLSTELRWFLPGNIPKRICDGFHQGELWQRSEPRTDLYLVFEQASTVGVKWREGKFEVKALIDQVENWKPSPHLEGAIQTWEKWSMVPESLDNPGSQQQEWVEVTKHRSLRLFAEKGGILHEYPVDQFVPQGCQLELTSVQCMGKPFWSLSLEAFGTGLDYLLKQIVQQHLLSKIDSPVLNACLDLSAENSLSYPEWLLKVRNIG